MSTFTVGLNSCYATLVGGGAWALTAAHCFYTAQSAGGHLGTFGRSFVARDVRFHFNTWPDHQTTWQTVRELGTATRAYDVAMVRLNEPVTDHPSAKLYHPAVPPSLVPQQLRFGGSGENAGQATGEVTIEGIGEAPSWGGRMLIGTIGTPSSGQDGDSGSGAFVTLLPSAPASVSFLQRCAGEPGGPNDEVLVGVYSGTDNSGELFVPVYYPEIVEWIASQVGDVDGDGICDGDDNCWKVPNSEQDNCNILAEHNPEAWQSTSVVELGDACDPAPCPEPSTPFVRFVDGPTQLNVLRRHGRAIHDTLQIRPTIGPWPADPVPASPVSSRFCSCRDAAGDVINDPSECRREPHYCRLDPREHGYEEVGGGDPPVNEQTYWRRMTFGLGTFAPWWTVAYPGPDVAERWAYKQDHARWLALGWVGPGSDDAFYGTGTELGGALWAHGSSTAGASEHGIDSSWCLFPPPGEPQPNCSIEDGFVYGIRPDRRSTRASGYELPVLKPAPWWSYCAQCADFFHLGGDVVSNPAPFLTIDPATREALVWGAEGGRTSDELSVPVRDALADASLLWVPASEPAGVTNERSAPRALVLAADGSVIVGWPLATGAGIELASVDQPTPLIARAGFAAAWSRTAVALFVAGGVDAAGAVQQDVWTWRPAGGAAASTGAGGLWSSAVMPAGLAPANASAAAFSHADWRLWVIDRPSSGPRLLRIDPATGMVEESALGVLADLEQVWLTVLADGRVLLAGRLSGEARFRLALLGSTPFVPGAPVSVLSVLEAPGALAATPQVRNGLVSLAFEQTAPDGVGALRIGSITASELEALGSGGRLTVCHIPPGKPAKARPLRVPPSALGGHLGHGDTLGDCFPQAITAGG